MLIGGLTIRIFISLAFTLLTLAPVQANQTYPPLRQRNDPALQHQLENVLIRLGLEKAAKKGILSVALVDITNLYSPRLAAVNGDEMMYAASLPKIAILLAACERIKRGELTLNEETHEKLTSMIRKSSNRAATEMLNRVGKSYVASLLQSPRYRLYDPAYNGGLWVGKEYGKAPAWRRDPLHNLSHGATALQVARFYYLLETGRLASPEMCKLMKAILSHPEIHHKFVKGLEEIHPDARIYRKSGTWMQYHSDSAIVEHEGRRYIAVALANSPEGGTWLSQLIIALDHLILHDRTPPT
jgi:beta-lactamase class A